MTPNPGAECPERGSSGGSPLRSQRVKVAEFFPSLDGSSGECHSSFDPSVPRNADLLDFAAGSAHVLSCEMLLENAPPQRGEVVMLDLVTSGDRAVTCVCPSALPRFSPVVMLENPCDWRSIRAVLVAGVMSEDSLTLGAPAGFERPAQPWGPHFEHFGCARRQTQTVGLSVPPRSGVLPVDPSWRRLWR